MAHIWGASMLRGGGRGGVGALAGFALLLSVQGGCAHPRTEARRMPAWVFESSRSPARSPSRGPGKVAPRLPKPRGGIHGRSPASDFVVAALQDYGLRFGTDGSVASLWGYLRNSHTVIPPAMTRPGDILFFDLDAPGVPGCPEGPTHAAIATTVDASGRIGFAEARNGRVFRSYLHPERPQLRRDDDGRVLNTFLRPKRVGDPPNTPTFAGEMLCGVARPRD